MVERTIGVRYLQTHESTYIFRTGHFNPRGDSVVLANEMRALRQECAVEVTVLTTVLDIDALGGTSRLYTFCGPAGTSA
jgi:hypothetical protein